jgi:hypothetical protein
MAQISGDLVQAGLLEQNSSVSGDIIWAGIQLDPNTRVEQILSDSLDTYFYFGPDLQINPYYWMTAHTQGANYNWFKDQISLHRYGSYIPFYSGYPLDSTKTGSYTCVVNGTDTSAALIVSNLYRTEPIYPDGDRLISVQSTFSWKKLPYTDYYQVQIAKDKYFNQIVFTDSSLTDTSSIISLDYNQQYYWRINSKIGQQWMGYSWTASFSTEPLVSIASDKTETPTRYALYQNYPNPFNPNTTISFDLPEKAQVRLEIFDLSGRRIQTLLDSHLPAGSHQVNFTPAGLSSGLYVYRLQTERFTEIKKMILLR